jgi:predicted dehydrogenase
MVCEPLPAYTVHGSKGSFLKQKTDVQETALQAGLKPIGTEWGQEPIAERGLLHTISDGKNQKSHVPSEPGNYMDYYEGIYQCLREGKANPVPAEGALQVVKIIELAFKSSEEQKLVKLA